MIMYVCIWRCMVVHGYACTYEFVYVWFVCVSMHGYVCMMCVYMYALFGDC